MGMLCPSKNLFYELMNCLELRYAVAFFFRECRGIKLAPRTTPESMEFENFFLIAPKAHRCEITLKN